jgi:hypothetical protein
MAVVMATYDIVGSGESLLLLHGTLASRAMWQPQMEAFSFHMLNMDNPKAFNSVVMAYLRDEGQGRRGVAP